MEMEDEVVPFEWLTNISTLACYLDPDKLFPKGKNDHENSSYHNSEHLKVLHVGCGSSILGETLSARFPRYNHVLNVDNDVETLLAMKNRWELVKKWNKQQENQEKSETQISMKYAHIDFQEQMNGEFHGLDSFEEDYKGKSKFDLVLDKSTLDCLLCSDGGAAGLLCTVYQHLKCNGVYFLVSFHDSDFILPLLEGCPGVNWTVEQHIVPRKVDAHEVVKFREAMMLKDIASFPNNQPEERIQCNGEIDIGSGDRLRGTPENVSGQTSSAWTSGTFHPDQEYGKSVNVFICRRVSNDAHMDDTVFDFLNREEVNKHIHMANDEYFKELNPMVTRVREEELRNKFLLEFRKSRKEKRDKFAINNSSVDVEGATLSSFYLSLEACYKILFTDAEKEHLPYEYFMEDWVVYSKEYREEGQLVEEGMTFDIALKFLETMQ